MLFLTARRSYLVFSLYCLDFSSTLNFENLSRSDLLGLLLLPWDVLNLRELFLEWFERVSLMIAGLLRRLLLAVIYSSCTIASTTFTGESLISSRTEGVLTGLGSLILLWQLFSLKSVWKRIISWPISYVVFLLLSSSDGFWVLSIVMVFCLLEIKGAFCDLFKTSVFYNELAAELVKFWQLV